MKDQLIKLISDKPETVFAPPENNIFIFESNVKDYINIDNLSQVILSNEKNIIEKYPSHNDGNTGLGENSLTSRYPHFNLFQWKDVNVKEVVRKTHDKFIDLLGYDNLNLYGQCWANVMRVGEQIKKHSHYNDTLTYLGGHICVQTKDTYTHYINPFTKKIYSSKNEEGKITLFPNWIEHYTDKHISPKERITVAFDLFDEKFYNTKVEYEMQSHWEKL